LDDNHFKNVIFSLEMLKALFIAISLVVFQTASLEHFHWPVNKPHHEHSTEKCDNHQKGKQNHSDRHTKNNCTDCTKFLNTYQLSSAQVEFTFFLLYKRLPSFEKTVSAILKPLNTIQERAPPIA
jgi:hypothetical protein